MQSKFATSLLHKFLKTAARYLQNLLKFELKIFESLELEPHI